MGLSYVIRHFRRHNRDRRNGYVIQAIALGFPPKNLDMSRVNKEETVRWFQFCEVALARCRNRTDRLFHTGTTNGNKLTDKFKRLNRG